MSADKSLLEHLAMQEAKNVQDLVHVTKTAKNRKGVMRMNLNNLEERIMHRMWRCNELSEKQAAHYAWVAVNELQKYIAELAAASGPLPEVNAVINILQERNSHV